MLDQFKIGSFLVAAFAVTSSFAQGVKVVDAPYTPAAEIPVITQAAPVATVVEVELPVVAPSAPLPVRVTSEPAVLYTVNSDDKTVRDVIQRWSILAGWTHNPEHWAVDRDLPVAGTAQLGTDFKDATRRLMASTELTDRPLQPCFYSNKVVRVVSKAELCDKSR